MFIIGEKMKRYRFYCPECLTALDADESELHVQDETTSKFNCPVCRHEVMIEDRMLIKYTERKILVRDMAKVEKYK